MLVAQSSNASSFQKEGWPIFQSLLHPAHSKCPQDVAVSYYQNVARSCLALGPANYGSVVLGTDLIDQSVDAFGYLLWAPVCGLTCLLMADWNKGERTRLPGTHLSIYPKAQGRPRLAAL
jgi:hypothetical protein